MTKMILTAIKFWLYAVVFAWALAIVVACAVQFNL